jgi:hypothetical protein
MPSVLLAGALVRSPPHVSVSLSNRALRVPLLALLRVPLRAIIHLLIPATIRPSPIASDSSDVYVRYLPIRGMVMVTKRVAVGNLLSE